MKSTESKTTTASQIHHSGQAPFFQQEPSKAVLDGEHQFFGGSPAPFFQPKLTIGAPDDPFEREADATAEKVVQRLTQPDAPALSEPVHSIQRMPAPVQRVCAECEAEEKLQKKEDEEPLQEKVQRKPIFDAPSETEGTIQRKCDDCGQEEQAGVQRQADGAAQTSAPANFSSQLVSSKGGGSALPAEVSAQMGQAMGADFSGVRVHTGNEAAEMSQSIQAQAFTHGSDIYFNEGKYDTGSTDGQKLLAHELTHTVQQGGAGGFMIQRTPLPQVDAGTLPASWTRTPLPLSGGQDVFVYRGFPENVVGVVEVIRPSDVSSGGVISRVEGAAHDAVFNQVGRNPTVGGPNSGGVLKIRIPAELWDELVSTSSIVERTYPGYGRSLVGASEIRVNSVEAANAINNLAREFVPPNEAFAVPGTGNIVNRVNSTEGNPVQNGGRQIPVGSQYRILSSQRIPGGNVLTEVEVILSEGVADLNQAINTGGSRAVPTRIVLRIVTNAEGLLISAEGAGVEATMAEFLARGTLSSIPRPVPGWVRGLAWAGLAIFVVYTGYQMAQAQPQQRPRILTTAVGGLAGGMVASYVVCNLILGIETLGASLILCGIAPTIVGGLIGSELSGIAYDEATIDDDEIRDWVSANSHARIALLPVDQKLNYIFSLMKGWVSDEDIQSIVRICDSVGTQAELNSLRQVIEPYLIELTDIGDRTTIRVALARNVSE